MGTINASGLYQAPVDPPSPNTVTVKAASVADSSRSDSASVTIANPVPQIDSVSPPALDAGCGDATLVVNGAGFKSRSVVQVNGTAMATTLVSSTELSALLPADFAANAGILSIVVETPSPGGGPSNNVSLPVLLVVRVVPEVAVVATGTSQQFTSSVIGSPNQAVSWSVDGVEGGDAILGTITDAGLYTPPAVPPSPNTVTVEATSLADPGRSFAASVSIENPVPQISSILPSTVDAGSLDTTLTIAGTGFTSQSTVRLDETALATVLVSPEELTATVPAAELASAAHLSVTVATPGPGGGTSNAVDFTVLIVVALSPSAQTVNVTETVQFVATVTGTTNQGVTWTVNEIAGGDTTLGTVDANGLYTAPGAPPSPNIVTVKAASVVDTTRTATALVTVLNPVPTITSVSPATINAGSPDTVITVNGTNFVLQSIVEVGGTPVTTTFSGDSTQLGAVVPAAQLATPGTVQVVVATPGPGGGTSSGLPLTVVSPVTVTPPAPTLRLNQTRQFRATVTGNPDQSVTWYVNDILGGDSTIGTISETGLYIAPGSLPSPDTVTVKAVSVADPSKSGTASVTLIFPPSDNYPRPGAGSVLRTPPPLLQVPIQGGTVAVLDWTAKDLYGTEEDVLAICHALSPFGIPHVHTTNLTEAVAYPFLAVAGVLEYSWQLTEDERNTLRAYVEGGGTLFLWRPVESGLLARFGITASHNHWGPVVQPITFDVPNGDPALRFINHEAEIHWQMTYPDFTPTTGYDPDTASALAWWDGPGDAAVLRTDLGSGRAYIFGWRLRHIVAEAERQIVRGDEPPWVNVPTLDADICRLLVRGAYQGWAGPSAQLRQFAPEGKQAALIITHDIDDWSSYERTPEFAQLESGQGFKATFNFTTSPYTSWMDPYYNETGKLYIQQALDLGHDIESHSFGHYIDFHQAPFGSGAETAENYFPQYSWHLSQTIGMSVIGELGVSRWLLETDFGITVEGFRSGYLLIPEEFLEGLRQTGYRRDSTYAAGVTRGYFPFVPFEVSGGTVTTYPIVEYPMALEDPVGLTEQMVTETVDAWEAVIRANYANNAPTVINIHPVSTPRRQALEELLLRIADLDLWIGDMKTFGEFWEAQGVTCGRAW